MTMRQTALTLFLCLFSLTAGAAAAPDWKPEKAIEIIVGVTPGGPNDTSARLLQKVMQDKRLVTVPVSVSNRAGATPMNEVLSYNAGTHTFTFTFGSALAVTKYFDDATGVFRRSNGDDAVVVYFGKESLIDAASVADIIFQGSTTRVHAAILNARFTGTTDLQRLSYNYWKGGRVSVKQVIFEPYNGVAILAYDLSGNALASVGNATWPGLTYVIHNADDVTSNFTVVGSMVLLNSWDCQGGMNYTYNATYLPRLPAYFLSGWNQGVSGTLSFDSWTEVNPGS